VRLRGQPQASLPSRHGGKVASLPSGSGATLQPATCRGVQTLPLPLTPTSTSALTSGTGDKPRGWDRTILYGNCVVIDVRFWRQPAIQRCALDQGLGRQQCQWQAGSPHDQGANREQTSWRLDCLPQPAQSQVLRHSKQRRDRLSGRLLWSCMWHHSCHSQRLKGQGSQAGAACCPRPAHDAARVFFSGGLTSTARER
jgi:hypothetical protein